MNLKCLICSDLFVPASEIYVTTCGHLFHYTCLVQWMDRSRTCPQCRNRSTEKTIHRVYISVEEEAEATDMGNLLNKLDNLQFQISLKDKDIKNTTEKYKVAEAQNVALREEIKNQESRVRVLESAMHALKKQVVFFKAKAREGERLEEEPITVREGKHISCNGIGGHCKNERFSTLVGPTGTKRTQSTSAISAAKYRKLAPRPQKKLNNFFPDTH